MTPGRVTVLAQLNAYTGYGLHLIQLVRGLVKLGVGPIIRPLKTKELFGAVIPEDIKALVKRGAQEEERELLLAPVWQKPTPGKKTIHFTMYETDSLPPDYVQNANRSEALIVPCQWNKRAFVASGVTRPIFVVPLGVDTNLFRSAGWPKGHFIFGAAGRLAHGRTRKGVERVAEAFVSAFPNEPNVRLEIKLHPDCQCYQVPDRRIVYWRAHWQEEQVARWLNSLHCFVSASASEAWGFWQQQAAACGRGLITALYGGVLEFLSENVLPLAWEESPADEQYAGMGNWASVDQGSLIEQMRAAFKNPEHCKALGQAVAAKAREFTWENSVRKTLEVLTLMRQSPMSVIPATLNTEANRHEQPRIAEPAQPHSTITQSAPSKPRFTISILAFNNLALTQRCIKSVLCHSGNDYELILTNNGSWDGVRQYFDRLAIEFSQIRVVHNRKNEGYQQPNRVALEMAKGEFFVLLNNDCEVCSGWLERLAEPFAKFPRAAISGPRSCASEILPTFHGQRSRTRFEYIEFSTACLKTALFRKHGLWIDGITFAYGEDSSTCLRMRELGYTLHLVPLVICHRGGATSRFVPEICKIQEHNRGIVAKRFAHYFRHRTFGYPIHIRRMDSFGDVLLTTPIISALRQQQPLSEIKVETACWEVFQNNPDVIQAAPRIEHHPKALVINLDMAYESLTQVHIVEAYAQAAGLSEFDYKTTLNISEEDDSWAKSELGVDNYVTIHRGPVTWRSKLWPEERWLRVMAALENMGLRVRLVGDRNEHRTSIGQMAALIRRSKLFIGLDSFPLHVAEAVGTQAIGLFGITDPRYILTRETSIAVCSPAPTFGLRHWLIGKKLVDDSGAAMAAISESAVLDAIQLCSV